MCLYKSEMHIDAGVYGQLFAILRVSEVDVLTSFATNSNGQATEPCESDPLLSHQPSCR